MAGRHDHDEIAQRIAEALACVNDLIEGGIDPFVSTKAKLTMASLILAQEHLENAFSLWTNPPRTRKKGVR